MMHFFLSNHWSRSMQHGFSIGKSRMPEDSWTPLKGDMPR